jgi:transposase-like protein
LWYKVPTPVSTLAFNSRLVKRQDGYSHEQTEDLNVEEKVKAIRETENGKKKADACREFSLVSSTIHTVWKNRIKIISAFEQGGLRIQRLRKAEPSDVDKALLKWFKQHRSDNAALSGPLLMTKAEQFADKLSDEEFVCSAGRIDRFKLRHGISFEKVSCKAKGVNNDTTEWPNVGEGYADSDNLTPMRLGFSLDRHLTGHNFK